MSAAPSFSALTAANHAVMKAFAFASGCAGILAGENGGMTAQFATVAYAKVQGKIENAGNAVRARLKI